MGPWAEVVPSARDVDVDNRLEYRILGPLEVLRGGEPVATAAGGQRTVLALLVLSANHVVSSGRLLDQVWGEQAPETAATSLHGHVSQLRKLLEPSRQAHEEPTVLLTRTPGYMLVAEPDAVDAFRFERLAGEGREALARGDHRRARGLLADALALWRGRALEDVSETPDVRLEALRLDELRLETLEDRVDADLALGRHAELAPELEALVRREPLRERLRAQLMLALYRSGRQADALEAYRRGRDVMLAELGLEPTPSLRRLEQGILSQDPALAAPALVAGAHGARGRRGVVVAGALAASAVVLAAAVLLLEDEPAAPLAPPDTVAVLDLGTRRIIDTIGVGAGPAAVAVGHGSIWVASADDGTVTRIESASRSIQRVIGVGEPCVHLAVGRDAVWVANGSSGTVTRLDPETNTKAATIDLSGDDPIVRDPVHAVAVGEGAVWAIAGAGALARIDPRTNEVTARFQLPWAAVSLAAGHGSVWAGVVSDALLRVDPRSGRVTATVPLGGWPYDVALADGRVLVSAGSLWVVDPSSATVRPTPRIDTDPVGATDVPGPGAWVVERRDDVAVALVAAGAKGGAPVPVGHEPSAVAYDRGALWITVRQASGS